MGSPNLREDERDADGHRWHSPEYVAAWIRAREGDASPAYLERQRERQRRILAAIPGARDGSLDVLELGTGWGRFAARILDTFPQARLVALDFSAPMLAEARTRLAHFGGRVRLVQRDLGEEGAVAGLGDGFDAVVTAQTLHHLPTARLEALYREIGSVLRPEGVFVGMDRVRARHRALLARLLRRATHGGSLGDHRTMWERAGFVTRAERLGREVLLVATRPA
jgi:SAM-dependent methyltransferase